MHVVRAANLAIRFLLELSLLIAFGWWGFGTAGSMATKILLGIGVPALPAIVWGKFLAPGSVSRLRAPWLLTVELLLFSSAIAALISRGQARWGWALAVVYAINRILLSIWRQ